MANTYPSVTDLGLGGAGDLLANEVKQDDDEKKKKLRNLSGEQNQQANSMGLAAMQLLGQFNG